MDMKTSKIKLLTAAIVLVPSVALAGVTQHYVETPGTNPDYVAPSSKKWSELDTPAGKHCAAITELLLNVLPRRDSGESPQSIYQYVTSKPVSEGNDPYLIRNALPPQEIKNIINGAFFDPQMSLLTTENLSQIYPACMQAANTPKYQPLK